MAHWAEIDENNIVIRVVVGDNNDINGDEGYQWIINNLNGRWIKTSFNTVGNQHRLGGIPLRKNYGIPGYTYDKQRDAFIPPKNNCHLEETLNEETCLWECYNEEHNLGE
jgi:hypothetical protein